MAWLAHAALLLAPPPLAKLGEERTPAASSVAPSADRRPCPDGSRVTVRETVLDAPRVDHVRCASPPDGARTIGWLVGLHPDGTETWRRRLVFESGPHAIDEHVLGASGTGIVLSNLTVVSPATGETVMPPATHTAGAEARPVPDHALTGAALYLPARRAFLWYWADVTLLRREGGLHAIDGSGGRELLLPVSATITGAHWTVEAMALAPSGTQVLLAERFEARGPGEVRLRLFDLDRREIVLEESFGEGHVCSEPRVAIGADGVVRFSYLDQTDALRVVVRYRSRD
jgi:hypothetical protein